MIGRRVATLFCLLCLTSFCLPLSEASPGSVHAAPVGAGARMSLGCSISNPAGPFQANCGGAGFTLGMTVHLAAATGHEVGGGYQLWITGRRVEPLPAVGAPTTKCSGSPCLTSAHVRNAKSFTHIVVYDFQAWLVFHPSGTPIVIKKSNVVRVAWAPKHQVVRIRRVRTVGRVITVRVALIHGEFEEGQYLDLRIINGPGRFTTIGFCPRPTPTNQGAAKSCEIPVNCDTYRARIEVHGRVVNADGAVTATSESLFLCHNNGPPPTPGLATWTLVTTSCTPTALNPNLKQVGSACYDQTEAILKVDWQVGPSSATWATPGWREEFQYAVPHTIPRAGASLSLAATATDLSGGGTNAVVCAGPLDFQVKNDVRPCAGTAEATGKGVTQQASKTVTLLSFKASSGSKATLVVGFQDGGKLTFTYQAK